MSVARVKYRVYAILSLRCSALACLRKYLTYVFRYPACLSSHARCTQHQHRRLASGVGRRRRVCANIPTRRIYSAVVRTRRKRERLCVHVLSLTRCGGGSGAGAAALATLLTYLTNRVCVGGTHGGALVAAVAAAVCANTCVVFAHRTDRCSRSTTYTEIHFRTNFRTHIYKVNVRMRRTAGV